MRVALFTREYPPHIYGGAGVHVDYLSRELAKWISVEVHCWGKQDLDRGHLHVRGQEPWNEISQGTQGQFKPALEALSLNLTQVKSLSGIDLVHTHTWYAAMAGLLAKKLYGMPFVLTTHSLEPMRAWKAEQLGSGYVMSSWMERTAILEADAVIAVSQDAREDVLRSYPLPPERVHVICNGIDLAEYRKTPEISALTKYGVDPTLPYVLFVGRITRQKGVTHLVDAIAFLPPETQVVLCAGSPDTPEIAAEMRRKVEQARLINPRVIWIEKMLSRSEAIQFYSNARVFCCPSVYEPFGIINLEAMACEVPVVASSTGGIKEVVVDGETGYLVPFDQDPATSFPRNPDRFSRDLADRLNELLANPQKCLRFGAAGRKRVEDRFSWSAIAGQTLALYRQLTEREEQRFEAGSPAGGTQSTEDPKAYNQYGPTRFFSHYNMRIVATAALVLGIASTTALGTSQLIPDGGTPSSSSGSTPAAIDSAPASGGLHLPAVSPDFIIGPGDILQISVWQEPQFGETVEVRPDGKISLPLVFDVHLAGFTTTGAQTELAAKLEEFVKHPVVSVVVAQVHSKQVYVIGQVQRPGPYPMLGPINVEQLIADAGGPTRRAKSKQVYVLRAGYSGKIPANYKKILQGKNAGQNIELRPGDTIVVP